jgi:tetratricopeptide (TPR) repeat protein
VARAVAAQEVLTTTATCGEEACQISLRRLDGRDGRVLWTEMLRVPLSRPRLLAEAVAAGVRRGYAGHGLRFASAELEIDEEEYRRYLDLRQRALARKSPELLPEATALRRQAAGFLETYVLESSLCRQLYTTTGDTGALEQGLAVARQANERWPRDPRPLFSLVDLQLAAGRTGPAAELLRRLAAELPGSSAVLLRQALLRERLGDSAGARDAMALAAEIHPSWQTLLLLANFEYRLGHPAEARRRAGELLARHPGSLDGAKLLAQIEIMEGHPGAALALLAPRARGTRDEEVLTHLGTAYLLLGRPAEAEAALRRALAARPDHPPALLNLADSLELRGRTGEARLLYRRLVAVSGDPGEGTASWPRWSNLAQALARLGESGRAIAAIQRALRLAPDSHQLAYEASLVYTLLGDRSSALFHAERALAGGVPPVWFRFPWFDPLRQDPGFAARTRPRPQG